MRYLVEEGVTLKRRMPLPWFYRVLMRLMPAEKRRAGARFSGYAMMERTEPFA